jgi:hypothetical protein
MDRKEAVHLASRALSLVFGVFGLEDTTYLPERLISYAHYTNEWRSAGAPRPAIFLPSLYRVEVGFLFVRIVIYLTLAVIFWKCTPWVERTLLPKDDQ